MSKRIFITATDTHAGKTVATLTLATLLRKQGHTVGVMKPVQCAGDDIQFLSKSLGLKDPMKLLNPFFAPEALSPHLALKRAKIKFDPRTIKKALKKLEKRYDIVLIEGAGGLMVPLSDDYYNIDLIRAIDAQVVIVSRLGLGTINHTVLTINQAKAYGLRIRGLLFSQNSQKPLTIAEQTNPQEIQKLSGVRVLGVIPYLKPLTTATILKQCAKIKLNF